MEELPGSSQQLYPEAPAPSKRERWSLESRDSVPARVRSLATTVRNGGGAAAGSRWAREPVEEGSTDAAAHSDDGRAVANEPRLVAV